jgi:hypothetical protein
MRWTAEHLAAASALSVATIRREELKENQTALTSANDLAVTSRLSTSLIRQCYINEDKAKPRQGAHRRIVKASYLT